MTSTKDSAYKPKSLFRTHVPLPEQLQPKKKKVIVFFGDTFPEIPPEIKINMENSNISQC